MDNDPRAPSAFEMFSVLAIAPVAGAMVFGLFTGKMAGARVGAYASAATALMLGWPLLFWIFDHGKTRLRHFVIVGVIMGGAPLVAAVLSGLAGLYMRSNSVAYVRRVLSHAAPLPVYGQMGWPQFAAFELAAIATGMLTITAFWFTVVRSRRHHAAN